MGATPCTQTLNSETPETFSKMRCFSNFIKFAITDNCPYRVTDQMGDANCFYYEDAPGYCTPEFCPLICVEGGDVLYVPR